MPAAMTHYQLGALVIEQLDQDTKQLVLDNREMFDLGVQGPDLLFFYRPYGKNRIVQIGHALHSGRAREFLDHIFTIRNLDDAKLTSYLLGVCCHYALDRAAHPYVNQFAPSSIEHQIIESSLDRLITDRYAIPRKRCTVVPHKRLSVEALVKVYPEVSEREMRETVQEAHCMVVLFEYPFIMRLIEIIMGKDKEYATLCVPKQIEDENAKLLFPYFEEAVIDAINLIRLYMDTDTTGDVFAEHTQHNFEGMI